MARLNDTKVKLAETVVQSEAEGCTVSYTTRIENTGRVVSYEIERKKERSSPVLARNSRSGPTSTYTFLSQSTNIL
jgi:hypothetical protein